MFQNNNPDFGTKFRKIQELKEKEARKKNAPLKAVSPKREFNMPKFSMTMTKINFGFLSSFITKQRVAVAAGGLAIGIGVPMLLSTLMAPKPVELKPFQVKAKPNKDSLAAVEKAKAVALFAPALNDVTVVKMKMDSLYSQNLNAFDKEYKDKDSAISLAVIEAKYATQKNFGKDSALLAEKHRNLSFNLDDNILTVGGKIDGKDKTLYAERLQELRHQ